MSTDDCPIIERPSGTIFYLDWDENELYGWEDNKNSLLVESIMRGIELGDDFPSVSVHEDEDIYLLSPLGFDGGHHRAIAHMRMRQPLKCKLLLGRSPISLRQYGPLSEITLVANRTHYELRRKNFPAYRQIS